MSEIDIFVSSTGVITFDHMRKLNDITLVGNTEHFDNEIDFAGSEGLDIKPQKIIFRLKGLYRSMCHPVFVGVHGLSTQQFVVPGFPGMSRLIGSWRPWAYSAWTIRAYGLSTPGQLETRLLRSLS